MQNSKDELNIKDLYGKNCVMSKNEVLKKFNTSLKGLTNKKADELIHNLGINEIKQKKQKKWYNYFLKSLFSSFNSILLGIAFVLLYTDIILADTPSYANIIVILILVLSSTFLEFFEEFRSNKAAEKLKELVATTADVIRNGKTEQIPIKNITLGDIVVLSAGSLIPADLRIIESTDLYVNQSSLTGESNSIKKTEISEYTLDDINSITNLDTIAFMGTNVVSRKCKRYCYKNSK